MFENITNFFKKIGRKEEKKQSQESSKNAAKERLHLVLMQDRANVSADFLELMKQEIIDVIKKYIEIDEKEIDVRLTNKENEDGTNGAPALYANIPILNIKNESRKINKKDDEQANKIEEKVEETNVNDNENNLENQDKNKKSEEQKEYQNEEDIKIEELNEKQGEIEENSKITKEKNKKEKGKVKSKENL